MINWGQNGQCERITLHDEELETASVLHGLFDIMVKSENILDLSVQETHPHTRRQLVIRLAQKHKYNRELHSIHQDLKLGLYVHIRNPWAVFELAVRLDDAELRLDAIKKSSTWTNEEGVSLRGEGEFGDALPGGGLFDIQTYSLESIKAPSIEVI